MGFFNFDDGKFFKIQKVDKSSLEEEEKESFRDEFSERKYSDTLEEKNTQERLAPRFEPTPRKVQPSEFKYVGEKAHTEYSSAVNELISRDSDNDLNSYSRETDEARRKLFSNNKDDGARFEASTPNSYDDIRALIVSLKNSKTILVDFQQLTDETAQRCLDLLAGATYALCGEVKQYKDRLYIFSSHKIDINLKR